MSISVDELQTEEESYLTDGATLGSWLLTRDHKRIAVLYFVSITLFFFIGGAAAFLIRYNLILPEGLIGSRETYNRTLYHARRHNGLVLPRSSGASDDRQLRRSADVGSSRSRFSKAESCSVGTFSLSPELSRFIRLSLGVSTQVGLSTRRSRRLIRTGMWC